MNFENFAPEVSPEKELKNPEESKKKKVGLWGTMAAAVGIAAGGVMAQEKADDGIIKGFGFESSSTSIGKVGGEKEFDVDAMFKAETGNNNLSIKKAELSGDAVPMTSADILEEGETWSVKGKNLKEVEASARAKEAEIKKRMEDKKKESGDFSVSMRD